MPGFLMFLSSILQVRARVTQSWPGDVHYWTRLAVASNLIPEKPGTKVFSRLSIQILTTENTEDTERASRFLSVSSVVFQECS